jgi:hypothetical protein
MKKKIYIAIAVLIIINIVVHLKKNCCKLNAKAIHGDTIRIANEELEYEVTL